MPSPKRSAVPVPDQLWSIRLLERAFKALEQISAGEWVRQYFIGRAPESEKALGYQRAASALDMYIVGWVVVEATLLVLAGPVPDVLIGIVAVYRIVEIAQVYGNGLLDSIRAIRAGEQPAVWSAARTLLQMIVLLFEVALLYGLLYWIVRGDIQGVLSVGDALYLSFGTITTGPTVASPHGWTRFLATSETSFGFLFGVAILGRFVGLLPAAHDATIAALAAGARLRENPARAKTKTTAPIRATVSVDSCASRAAALLLRGRPAAAGRAANRT